MNHPINKNFPLSIPFIKENFPKFSIIISCYNKENIISKTVDLLQEADIIQKIILVDDGSTDNTLKEIKNIQNVDIIVNDKNMGWGYSNNKALEKIDTEYSVFMDADCFIGTYGWLITWYLLNRENNNGESGELHYSNVLLNVDYLYNHLMNQKWVHSNTPFSNKVIEKNNNIDIVGHIGGNYKIFKTKTLKEVGGFSNSPRPVCVEFEISLRMKFYNYNLIPYRIPNRLTALKGESLDATNNKYLLMKESINYQKKIFLNNNNINGLCYNISNYFPSESIYYA